MYAGRTSEIILDLSEFEEFFKDLQKLVEKHGKNNMMLKIESNFDDDIIKIFGEKITALARAKNGIAEVTELAYTTAEHHPYWNILYSTSEITTTILEKWRDKISNQDIEDIEWALKEITQTLNKIKEKSQ